MELGQECFQSKGRFQTDLDGYVTNTYNMCNVDYLEITFKAYHKFSNELKYGLCLGFEVILIVYLGSLYFF